MVAAGVPADRLQLEAVLRGWLEIWDLPLPVIAQVHGACLAGGTQLAAICDVTFVADDALVGTPQLPLGAGYVASFWAWFVGPKKAKEIFFETGRDDQCGRRGGDGPLQPRRPRRRPGTERAGVRPRRGPPAEGPPRPPEAGDQPDTGGPGLPRRRCCRAPRSTPSPTPRRPSGPSTATSPSTAFASRWPRSAAATSSSATTSVQSTPCTIVR